MVSYMKPFYGESFRSATGGAVMAKQESALRAQQGTESQVTVSLSGIGMSFSGVSVLRDVDLTPRLAQVRLAEASERH